MKIDDLKVEVSRTGAVYRESKSDGNQQAYVAACRAYYEAVERETVRLLAEAVWKQNTTAQQAGPAKECAWMLAQLIDANRKLTDVHVDASRATMEKYTAASESGQHREWLAMAVAAALNTSVAFIDRLSCNEEVRTSVAGALDHLCDRVRMNGITMERTPYDCLERQAARLKGK